MRLFLYIFFTIFTLNIIVGQELVPKQKKSKWGYVNHSGEWVIKPKFHEVSEFKEGLACVRIKNKWGYINKSGKKLTPFQYSAALSFSNGLAAVRPYKTLPGNTRENNNQYKWGYIDLSGTLTIPYLFKSALDFDNKERALVQLFKHKKNEQFWINKSGEAISPPFIEKIKEGNIFKIVNKRNDGIKVYRYIKNDGNPVTEWYLNDFNLNQDLIKVWLPSQQENDTIETNAFKGNSKKKLCSYINKNGAVLCDWYSEIKPFKNGFAPIRHFHYYGFIDSSFQLIVAPKYREISLINDSTYKGQIEYGKTVLISTSGIEKSLSCHDFEVYSDSLFLGIHELKSSYRNELKYAIFNSKGKQITGWYNKIHDIHNFIVRIEDERPHYTKENGLEYVAKYNYIQLKTGDLITTWRPTTFLQWEQTKIKKDSILSYLFLSTPTIKLSKIFFNQLYIKEFEFIPKEQKLIFSGGDFHNGMALVSIKAPEKTAYYNKLKTSCNTSKYGYIDWYGDLIIPYRYEDAAAFRDEYAVYRKNGKYGAINSKGKTVIKPQYNMLGAYGSGLFPFLNDKGKWGYINRANRIQIESIFDNATPFSYGYASVKKGKYWGLIDVMGNEIMPFDYKKSIEIISPKKVKFLQSGVGYIEKEISEQKK